MVYFYRITVIESDGPSSHCGVVDANTATSAISAIYHQYSVSQEKDSDVIDFFIKHLPKVCAGLNDLNSMATAFKI